MRSSRFTVDRPSFHKWISSRGKLTRAFSCRWAVFSDSEIRSFFCTIVAACCCRNRCPDPRGRNFAWIFGIANTATHPTRDPRALQGRRLCQVSQSKSLLCAPFLPEIKCQWNISFLFVYMESNQPCEDISTI